MRHIIWAKIKFHYPTGITGIRSWHITNSFLKWGQQWVVIYPQTPPIFDNFEWFWGRSTSHPNHSNLSFNSDLTRSNLPDPNFLYQYDKHADLRSINITMATTAFKSRKLYTCIILNNMNPTVVTIYHSFHIPSEPQIATPGFTD